MITLRRDKERSHLHHDRQDVWQTFYPQDHPDHLAGGFGVMIALNEMRLSPGEVAEPYASNGSEIVAYVDEGSLAFEDTAGMSDLIHSGEFLRMVVGLRVRNKETNPSKNDYAHVYHIWLRAANSGEEPSREQKRFTFAERKGVLRVVASPDGRNGSLILHRDVIIFSAILEPGRHLIHELAPLRSAWLHVVRGEIFLGDFILVAGDGAGFSAERAVSITAQDDSEILLIDLPENNKHSVEIQ